MRYKQVVLCYSQGHNRHEQLKLFESMKHLNIIWVFTRHEKTGQAKYFLPHNVNVHRLQPQKAQTSYQSFVAQPLYIFH